jgi:hypothetical protein
MITDAKPSGNEGWYSARCPGHNDKSASLSFRENENGGIIIHCFAGCERETVIAAAGLKPSDLYAKNGYKPAYIPRPKLELIDLAYDKFIPWQFLFNLGVEDEYKWNGQTGCKITYFTETGEIHPKVRVRIALTGKKGSFWDKDTPGEIIPYGLHRLDLAREQGFLLIGEGESDAWTCWFHGVPFLGVPGATNDKCLQGNILNNIPRLYIIQEPDAAGQGFYSRVHRQLRTTGYTGEMFALPFKEAAGHKDPNALHKALKGQDFKEKITAALENAIPAGDDLEENDEELPRVILSQSSLYERTPQGMLFTYKGETMYLSNFAAEIKADVTTDDGAERTRSYIIEADLSARRSTFEIVAKDFAKCDWVDTELGASAIITTGKSIQSHLINAIKTCSTAEEQYHFAHTGWRNIDGEMVYLHNDGYVGQVGQVLLENKNHLTQQTDIHESASRASLERENNVIGQVGQVGQVNKRVRVKLTGSLEHYKLPCLDINIQQAIKSSLTFLDLTTDTITVPLYASLWRSVLPYVNYAVHLAGQSGQGKTELAAIINQYFGASMDASKLPGSWVSTENSLEMLLFQAKDTVVVVDDFKPIGGKADQDRLHAKADRIFRVIGNGAARGRLNSNLEQRAERRPRCLLISTGEDIPRGQSLKARGVVLVMTESVTRGEASKRLSAAQKDARAGVYAQVMTRYLTWIAPRIAAIQDQLQDLVAEERERLTIPGHARAGTNTANMILGMRYFLTFATECGAISIEEAQSYLRRCQVALQEIANDAAKEDRQEKPSEQWRRLLVSAISSRNAHLTDENGNCPGIEYGWIKSIRGVTIDGAASTEETVRGGGDRIGWIEDEDIYLYPVPAYKAAKAMGSATSDDITTLESTLRKFLNQDGILASTDLATPRNTITVRRRLGGSRENVLHLKKSMLFADDTPMNLVDPLDLLDPRASKAAPQADLRPGQVVDQNGRGSSKPLDPATGLDPETEAF